MTTGWTIPQANKKKAVKRRGRGSGSGSGKTAGRGHKGQNARSGALLGVGFEGGQMPFYRRIPKVGFRNIFRKPYQVVNLRQLEKLPADINDVTPTVLWTHRLIQDPQGCVKILGNGELTRKMKVHIHALSASAKAKIEKAGGHIEVITLG